MAKVLEGRVAGRMGKLSVKKTKIVKEDGRYLIFYTFVEEGEEEASPAGGQEQEDGGAADETGPAAEADDLLAGQRAKGPKPRRGRWR